MSRLSLYSRKWDSRHLHASCHVLMPCGDGAVYDYTYLLVQVRNSVCYTAGKETGNSKRLEQLTWCQQDQAEAVLGMF